MTARSRSRTLVRYTLFQIPGLILLGLGVAAAVRWWNLSVFIAYGVVVVWIAKDVIMYPILRVAYEAGDSSGVEGIHGAFGVVTQPLVPSGYVKLGSERWKAELVCGDGTVSVGSAIRVVELRGLTLIVEPVTSAES
ncbi:MAG: NfeD family protein [Myxococcales bacterium]|nr:NfeD family protein [Myxococcales bacterium]